MRNISSARLRGVWSATPTPLTNELRIDRPSVERLIEHHLRLGVKGLFLCGTCGEGPWMPDRERSEMVRTAVKAADGRLLIAVQVTDNSAARILDNMHRTAEDGADIAVIAPPFFLMNATPDNIAALYLQAIKNSPLPVGVYDRGSNAAVAVTDRVLQQICAEPEVIMIKDSSADPQRRQVALKIREKRPDLRLLNGNEFACAEYMQADYDGLLLGGGIFNGLLAGMIIDAVDRGQIDEAENLQLRMNRLMYDVYGGEKIACWLAGLKYLLVEMGVFSTTAHYLNYTLTPECRQAVAAALQRERKVLLP